MSLKEFVLSAFREQGGSSKHVGFESDAIRNLEDCAESTTICHISKERSEKPRCGQKNKTATEMERAVVVHFKHVLPQGPAALHKRSSNQRCRLIKNFLGFKSERLTSLF